jgi:hypothetical protein
MVTWRLDLSPVISATATMAFIQCAEAAAAPQPAVQTQLPSMSSCRDKFVHFQWKRPKRAAI